MADKKETWKYYRTKNSDTWDLIAFKLYQNSKLINELIQWNEEHSELVILPANLDLKYKDITATSINIAPWRK